MTFPSETLAHPPPPPIKNVPYLTFGTMVGTVVRAITLCQCGLGSILGLDAIYGLSLLVLGCEGFSPSTFHLTRDRM